MKTFILKYIFYITSITENPSSQVLIVQPDSVTYWDYTSYKTKRILYKKRNLIIVDQGWIVIHNNRIKINSFRTRETITYKIRYMTDQDNIKVKDKPNTLY